MLEKRKMAGNKEASGDLLLRKEQRKKKSKEMTTNRIKV